VDQSGIYIIPGNGLNIEERLWVQGVGYSPTPPGELIEVFYDDDDVLIWLC
jgi:hypothetical protein